MAGVKINHYIDGHKVDVNDEVDVDFTKLKPFNHIKFDWSKRYVFTERTSSEKEELGVVDAVNCLECKNRQNMEKNTKVQEAIKNLQKALKDYEQAVEPKSKEELLRPHYTKGYHVNSYGGVFKIEECINDRETYTTETEKEAERYARLMELRQLWYKSEGAIKTGKGYFAGLSGDDIGVSTGVVPYEVNGNPTEYYFDTQENAENFLEEANRIGLIDDIFKTF